MWCARQCCHVRPVLFQCIHVIPDDWSNWHSGWPWWSRYTPSRCRLISHNNCSFLWMTAFSIIKIDGFLVVLSYSCVFYYLKLCGFPSTGYNWSRFVPSCIIVTTFHQPSDFLEFLYVSVSYYLFRLFKVVSPPLSNLVNCIVCYYFVVISMRASDDSIFGGSWKNSYSVKMLKTDQGCSV